MLTPTPVPALDFSGLAAGVSQATTNSPVLVPVLALSILVGVAFYLVGKSRKAFKL